MTSPTATRASTTRRETDKTPQKRRVLQFWVVADRGGPGSSIYSNELECRTGLNTPIETSQKSPAVSNFVPELSRAVKFVLKCIASLDVDEVEELAHEISPDDADQLAIQILEEACATREAWGGGSLFAQVAEEYRRNRPDDPHPEIECDLPDFDDPDFLTKLHTDSAPLPDRKRLFVRLWNGFELEDKQAFLSRVDPNGVFRQVAA
ncbi:hypothetical protein HGG71_12125 [Rhodobacteraceae bacterium R_SAG2]|nr:hypothetical protein [Rhodobacteraceae bacterium R_SAG2]